MAEAVAELKRQQGGSKRLFGEADRPTKLSLVDSKPTSTGG